MKKRNALRLLACAMALAASARPATAAMVNISMNVFPTMLANPKGGGTFTLVAKTDSQHGIAGISFYVKDIDIAGLTIESDIGALLNNGNPFVGVFGGAVNLAYGQDTANGPVVLGVGTLATSDGPDLLGNPAWNDATRIISGTYSSTVPMFVTNVGPASNNTDANTLSTSVGPPFNFSLDADTTTVVRVAVPEPATMIAVASALAGLLVVRRRR